MSARLVAIVVRPTPSMLTIRMQQRFWSFAAQRPARLYLVPREQVSNEHESRP